MLVALTLPTSIPFYCPTPRGEKKKIPERRPSAPLPSSDLEHWRGILRLRAVREHPLIPISANARHCITPHTPAHFLYPLSIVRTPVLIFPPYNFNEKKVHEF